MTLTKWLHALTQSIRLAARFSFFSFLLSKRVSVHFQPAPWVTRFQSARVRSGERVQKDAVAARASAHIYYDRHDAYYFYFLVFFVSRTRNGVCVWGG